MKRTAAALIALSLAAAARAEDAPKIAAVVTVYHHNSHADVIVSRLLQTDTLDGKGEVSPLQLASLYTDQVPERDISRRLAKEHKFPIFDSVAEALTLGTGSLAVDGVLLIAEHGDYPESDTGQTVYPKRRLFGEIVKVFEASGRSVPVFCDKHLADNWSDAKWIYDEARRLKIPLMAGSSLPVLWRYPPTDVPRDKPLKEMVGVSYHRLDAYGFHALEMAQCLAERRQGGETGIASVRCLTGAEVWKARDRGDYDRSLLELALKRFKTRPAPTLAELEKLVPEPVAFIIDYRDGLRTTILTLNNAVSEWAIAWKDGEGQAAATLFWTQEARPFHHFAHLLSGIEQMMLTGEPAWPVERTLLTSGALDALLISKKRGGQTIETPYLNIAYESNWSWREPPPPPADRPIDGQ
jgi:hypothetical protein